MNITDERLHEFMRIYKAAYGEDLSKGEAKLMADRLMFLYERLSRPLPSERAKGKPQNGEDGDIGDLLRD
jgi:hypothetical protein